MENNIHVLNQVLKDIETKFNEHLAAISETNCNSSDDIIQKLDIHQLENEVCEKYKHTAESTEIKFSTDNEELWASFNVTDYDDYDKIIQSLHNSKSNAVQIRALNKLLSAYIIDTKQKSWLSLAKNLQQCLISSNDEVFEKSLKIHYKIISTPNACSEGYLNLIQTIILIFNSEAFKNCEEINETKKVHQRVLCILKLILKTQKVLLKNWLHAKQKLVEEVMITFVYMLNYSLGSEHELGALDFLAFLDSEANWFKKFCYGLQTRNIISSCLKRTHNLVDFFINTFVNYLDDNFSHSRNHRQFLNFSHSVHFLVQFFTYRNNFSVFPVKLKNPEEIVTFEYFVFIIITKINDWTESPRRRILIELLQCLLTNNFNLILNPDIHKKLFEPFVLKNKDKKELYATVERNIHILEFMNILSKSQYSKLILYNLSNLKKPEKKHKRNSSTKEKFNILHIISSLTIACIRNFINTSEMQHSVNNVIFELTDCCINLYRLHARSFTSPNINKLIIALRDFYKTVMNHEISSAHYKTRIAISLCFFIESYSNTVKTLESESGFLHEIVCNALTNTNSLQSENSCSSLILSIANSKEGNEVIAHNHDVFVKQLLVDIWAAENDEEDFMLGVSKNFEWKTNKLLHLLHIISYNFQAVKALLSFENEDTIVENQERPFSLVEVVENCLDSNCSGMADTLLGLKIIKILITNADVLLYFQNNYKLQENLIELQVNSRMPCLDDGVVEEGTAILIDEYSSLRHNILLSIKYFGKIDGALNEKLLDQTRLVVAPYQSSSPLRRYQKSTSELQKFLHDSKNGLHDHSWLAQARRAFKIGTKEKFKTAVVVDLIEHAPKTVTQNNLVWPPNNAVLFALFPEEQHGVALVVRFGIQNGILHSSVSNEDNLTLLLKQSLTFSGYRPDEFVGFDWFTAVIFLICSGSLEKSKATLLNISNTSAAVIIWPNLYAGTDKKQNVCDNFYRQLEIILQDTTKFTCAFQNLGTSVRHIVQKWLNHSFFTILDFNEVCNFVSMAILFPPEYVLFFIVAVLEHIKDQIFTLTHTCNIMTALKMTKVVDFHVSDYLNFMDKLFKQYRNVLQF